MDDHPGRDAVDIALTLLADRGFDATSMAQIAEATGIAADEVVGVLGTKDEIVLAVAEDMTVAVIDVLKAVGPDTPVVEALMTAHSQVVVDIIAGRGPISSQRMRSMSKAITSSASLQREVAAQRTAMLSAALAGHLETSTKDRRVQQGLKLWSAVLAATYMDVLDKHGRFDPDVDVETPEFMHQRLKRAFRIVTGRSTRTT